jgi:hypothetical protein
MKRTTEIHRIDFYRRHLSGETYEEIGEYWGFSRECVRYWCRKQKKGKGVKSQWKGSKRGVLSQFSGDVVKKIQELREKHPRWGPISIRMELEEDHELKKKGFQALPLLDVGCMKTLRTGVIRKANHLNRHPWC